MMIYLRIVHILTYIFLSVQVEDFTHLNTDIIQSVKRGVEFGRLLQLPDEASFTSFHMADILTAKGLVRPLYQLRYITHQFLIHLAYSAKGCE